MRKILALALSFLMIFALVACGGDNTETTTDKDTVTTQAPANILRVGLECAYAPFNWTQVDSSNGAVKIDGQEAYAAGYDVEIAKLIAAGLNKELVIIKTEWDGLIPALQSGTIDLVIAGMSPTAERKQEIDFSKNYYTSQHVIIVKENGPYANAKSLEDFKGAKITGQLGTIHYDLIDQIEGAKKETALADFSTMRTALDSGVIDAYVAENPEGLAVALSDLNFKMVEFEEGKGFNVSAEHKEIAAGMKKGSDLLEDVNAIIVGISEEKRAQLMSDAVAAQGAAVSDEDISDAETSNE